MSMKIAAVAAAMSFASSAALAAPTVDGALDAGAYGAAKSQVTYAPGTPTSNFDAPTPFSDITSYSIYLTSDANNVYGFLKSGGLAAPGATPPSFANLYFDIDPNRADPNGSDIGFEIGSNGIRAFVAGMPGGSGEYASVAGANSAISSDGTGIEFSIPNGAFSSKISGLTYYGNEIFPSNGGTVTLRLSQSFGYSVAGGELYGPDRLGSVVLGGGETASPAPEPATWAMMIVGFGLAGAALRRRRAPGKRIAFA